MAAQFPWELVPRVGREEARVQSIVARWLGVRAPSVTRLRAAVGGDVRARVVAARAATAATGAPTAATDAAIDADAAACEVRVAGASIVARGSSRGVRRIAQKLLGGPEELPAPRPLGKAERAIWAMIVGAAVEDLGIGGEVWPVEAGRAAVASGVPTSSSGGADIIELAVELAGIPLAVWLDVPVGLALRVPPVAAGAAPPPWTDRVMYDLPIVVARCALDRTALAALRVRDLITVEGGRPELVVFSGVVGLAATPGAVVAEVATGYVRRDMSLPDQAHVELTVALGTARMSLRQITELAVGQIVPLGRPLAGPFELRAEGRRVGQGELVDVDGELAVRIVSLESA